MPGVKRLRLTFIAEFSWLSLLSNVSEWWDNCFLCIKNRNANNAVTFLNSWYTLSKLKTQTCTTLSQLVYFFTLSQFTVLLWILIALTVNDTVTFLSSRIAFWLKSDHKVSFSYCFTCLWFCCRLSESICMGHIFSGSF